MILQIQCIIDKIIPYPRVGMSSVGQTWFRQGLFSHIQVALCLNTLRVGLLEDCSAMGMRRFVLMCYSAIDI